MPNGTANTHGGKQRDRESYRQRWKDQDGLKDKQILPGALELRVVGEHGPSI